PRPAHLRVGIGLARALLPPPEEPSGTPTRSHRRTCGRFRRRVSLRLAEPRRRGRPRPVDALTPALGGVACVPGHLSLGSALDEGSPPPGRARAPGGIDGAGAQSSGG